MKSIITTSFLTCFLLIASLNRAIAQPQLSGTISGVLEGDTTYTVIGNISVATRDSLIIEAGATLIFNSDIEFDINGYLHAAGTETDSIKFINAIDSTWGGIDFNATASDSSKLEYCLITGSASSGIYCSNSSPAITDCAISGNTSGYGGGGIYCSSISSPAISNCAISGNTANNGGGIYCHSSSPAFTNCAISGNTADYGGGIYCQYSSPDITGCTISGNTAGWGGGIFCDASSPAISNCIISGNTAGNGGGIDCYYISSPIITKCTISGNTARAIGGGIWCYNYSSPVITNCTISENMASGYGGGIYCWNYCSPNILNTIVEGNQGNYGVYLYNSSNTNITYCDFHNNQYGNFYNPPQSVGQILTVNANGDSCDIYHNIFLDPMFVDSANGDFHLLWGSPCIDAGDPESPFDPDSTITDMGAFYFDQSQGVEDPTFNLLPFTFSLSAYPNPFNEKTTLLFSLPVSGKITLTIFDISGREVFSSGSRYYQVGENHLEFNGAGLASGLYFAQVEFSGEIAVAKLLLIK